MRSFQPQPLAAYKRTIAQPPGEKHSVKARLEQCIALMVLTLIAPLLVLIAAVILMTSGRPILFLQTRQGQHHQGFNIFKFRTMEKNKVTPIGTVLRQCGLDELPQLWNIVRGEMSWVGPRPLTKNDIERLQWTRAYYQKRWLVKPGITGLAQLYGGIGKKVTWLCDRRYVEKWSPLLDCQIIIASALICFLGKRRVRQVLYRWRQK